MRWRASGGERLQATLRAMWPDLPMPVTTSWRRTLVIALQASENAPSSNSASWFSASASAWMTSRPRFRTSSTDRILLAISVVMRCNAEQRACRPDQADWIRSVAAPALIQQSVSCCCPKCGCSAWHGLASVRSASHEISHLVTTSRSSLALCCQEVALIPFEPGAVPLAARLHQASIAAATASGRLLSSK